jgi:lipopolysaccharide export system permease protein
MDAGAGGPGPRTGKHDKEMYLGELLTRMDGLQPGSKPYNLAEMEVHKKFTLPFSCLVMALIGLPLGTHSRSGRSWGVAVALGVFAAYYLMLSAAYSFGATGGYPPRFGMWVPNLVFGLLGILIFNREMKETPMPFLDSINKIPAILARLRGRSADGES